MKAVFGYNLKIAFESVAENKFRAFLTSLGIIFGAASVIAMLAVGKGAENEIVKKLRTLGAKNVIVKTKSLERKGGLSLSKSSEEQNGEETAKGEKKTRKSSPGLTLSDARGILEIAPQAEKAAPEIQLSVLALANGKKTNLNLIGTNRDYFAIRELKINSGAIYGPEQENAAKPVCVLGWRAAAKLFPGEDPIGKKLKCGWNWLTVIGVLKEKALSKETIKSLGIRDYNMDVYAPISTVLSRYVNRAKITSADVRTTNRGGSAKGSRNQIDKILIKAKEVKYVKPLSEAVGRFLKRRHNGAEDYEIIVPEALIEQEKNARRIFNIALGAIASISLLVGGIGIMNIMLASVMERTREIGTRMAVGAKKTDIAAQFLLEASALSFTGGIIGVIVGTAFAYAIQAATGLAIAITPFSIIISFVVSISVGLIFGISPAKKAAEQNPIDLLRYE